MKPEPPDDSAAPVLILVAIQDLVNLGSCIRVAKNFGITRSAGEAECFSRSLPT